MIKITKLFFAASAALALNVQAAEIRIAVDGSYAPFAVVDAQGQLQGFDIDIANALCQQMQAQCRIVPQAWDGMIPGLKVGKFDAIISSMSITKERARVVDFSDRYYSNVLTFIGAKNRPLSPTKDMHGLTVGAYRSTVSSQHLEDNYADQVAIKLYDNQEQAYLDLKAGRIDLLLSDKFPAYDWIGSTDGQDYEFKGKDIDIQDQVAIAIRKGSELRGSFNKAIAEIRANGTYQQINAKYFPFSIY